MAALSSMIKIRRLASATGLDMGAVHCAAGQLEHERCAAAGAVALDAQRAAEFLGRERSAVQAEPMSRGARGEAVREQPRHVFRADAHSVVDDANAHPGRHLVDSYREKLFGPARFVACIL